MNFYLDTEFREGVTQRKVLGFNVGQPVPTIDLISLGCVCEDGRELYLLNGEHDLQASWNARQENGEYWLRENVLRAIYEENVSPAVRHHMPFSLKALQAIFRDKGRTRRDIGYQLLIFTQPEAYDHWTGPMDTFYTSDFAGYEPTFFTHYGDYDWVVTMQCFGTMMMKPKSFPYLAFDLKQEQDRLGITSEFKQKLCPDPKKEHHALEDARWAKQWHQVLQRRGIELGKEHKLLSLKVNEVEHLLRIPALEKHDGMAEKVRFMLKTLAAAARGEQISNKPGDYY